MILSPSKAFYLSLCPRYQNDPNSDPVFSERGKRLHRAIANGDFSTLEDEGEREAVAFCMNVKGRLPPGVVYHEFPLDCVLDDEAPVPVVLKGTTDILWLDNAVPPTQATILDWKFGRGAVEPSETNLQLRGYALCVFDLYPAVQRVQVGVVQPATGIESHHEIARSECDKIRKQYRDILDDLAQCEQDPNYGYSYHEETCLYCGIKKDCPIINALATRASSNLPEPVREVMDLTLPATPEVRRVRQQLATLFTGWAEQVKRDNLTAVVEDGVVIPGYTLRKRMGAAKVRDAVTAQSLTGLTTEQFLQACSVSLPKLSEVTSALSGSTKKEAREELEAKLQTVIERDQDIVYLQKG